MTGSWNQSDIKQDVIWTKCITSSFNDECSPRAGKMDWSSFRKRVIKWVNFNKASFFFESNSSESNK